MKQGDMFLSLLYQTPSLVGEVIDRSVDLCRAGEETWHHGLHAIGERLLSAVAYDFS